MVNNIPIAFLGRIGFPELILILIIVLLLFGAKKLPEIARALGLGVKEFKKSVKEINDISEEEKKTPSEEIKDK